MADRVRELLVNGSPRPLDVDPERKLLSVLRDELDLTGAKYGCGEGRCGACTVLLDNQPTHACLVPVKDVVGKSILTIEGLAQGEKLHPLQQAFLDREAFQCGYCTPGMIMAGLGLLLRKPDANDDEIRQTMDGQICRCGTYNRIIAALRQAGPALQQGAEK